MRKEEPNLPSRARRARLIRNGTNHEVRMPGEFELIADEVLKIREDDPVVVVPDQQPLLLAEVLSRLKPLEEDFPNVADPATNPQDFL